MYLCMLVYARLRELDSQGKQVDDALLRSAGFTVGQSVSRKPDDTAAKVVSMRPDRVTVELEDGSRASVSAKSFLSGEWRVVKGKGLLPATAQHGLVGEPVQELLKRILETHKNMQDSLSIFLKPKMVTVETKQAVHRLQILPLTCKLDVRPDAEASPNASAVCVGVMELMGDTYKAWLLPMHVAPDPDKADRRAFLHPFWLMKTTANEDEANMETRKAMQYGGSAWTGSEDAHGPQHGAAGTRRRLGAPQPRCCAAAGGPDPGASLQEAEELLKVVPCTRHC